MDTKTQNQKKRLGRVWGVLFRIGTVWEIGSLGRIALCTLAVALVVWRIMG